MRVHIPLFLFAVMAGLPAAAQPVAVQPLVETRTVARGGSSSQDVALWVNPNTLLDGGAIDGGPIDGGQGLVVVADSVVGLISFRLDGSENQALLSDGVAYGVDVRDSFSVLGGSAPLVVAVNGSLQALTAYIVDPVTLQLRRVDTGTLTVQNFSPRTVTLYRSAATGTLYAFTADSAGSMQQLELRPVDGGVQSFPVRNFPVGGPVAGAVADDAQGYLFVAEQNAGIWRYSAEPDAGTARTSVATATDPLTTPLGGLGLYPLPGNKGYLLAASAGGDQVVVYERQPPHRTVGAFTVVQDGGIDAVTGPTTVEATSRALGPSFPAGLVAVHDAINDPIQNDKLVSWTSVANAFSPPLQSSTDAGADGGTSDGGTSDGGTTDGGKDGGQPSGPGGPGTTYTPDDSGCGCSTASVPGALLFVMVGFMLLSRRRRS
ncbi:myxosortase-dependent phytase-like phosphatase [Hyalangium versicolor]|uniref:myxosortase-dependent phytase-like phosphatase n=1 Tax=Hyalangium versicolor TaxID=2861190 RepID=UPI001CC94DD6|nr:myxosortase-dependent phytase-like phosphatase [Hyalangium versicolor]